MAEAGQVWVRQYLIEELQPVQGISGRWMRYINGDETGLKLISGLGMLAPGEDMGWHSHPEEEMFYVLSGHGLVRWEQSGVIHEREVGPGFAFYKEGNIPHQMVNIGEDPFLGIFAKVSDK
jgi:quercetin dioxygenase-like cupin family protein